MGSFPFVRASVETCGVLVVSTLTVFPDSLVGGSVPVVLLGRETPGVCIVAVLGDATEPLLLSAVATWVTALGRVGVAAAGVESFTTVRAPPEMLVGGTAGLYVTVGACGWVGPGLMVG